MVILLTEPYYYSDFCGYKPLILQWNRMLVWISTDISYLFNYATVLVLFGKTKTSSDYQSLMQRSV